MIGTEKKPWKCNNISYPTSFIKRDLCFPGDSLTQQKKGQQKVCASSFHKRH